MRLKSYSVPEFLQFETTYSCNSHCVFCYNPSREQSLSRDLTWRVIERIGEAHVPLVQLTGGEVTLMPDLNQYIDHLHNTSRVSIVTNGIRRRDLSANLSKIFVSLHGDRVTHERITNNRGTYEKICANIRQYVREGFRVSADVILCSENFDQMYRLIEHAAELGMTEVFINRFQSGGIGVMASDSLMPPLQMFKQALDQLVLAKEELGIPIVFGTTIPLCVDERLLTADLFRNCNMGTRFASIAPNGDLRACNQALKNYGNILSTPLEELWQSPSMDDYRDLSWVTGVCRDCPLLEHCGGGCRVDNSQDKDYCPDAFVRNFTERPKIVERVVEWLAEQRATSATRFLPGVPVEAEPGLLLVDKHPEKYIVRDNYSVIIVDRAVLELVRRIATGQNNPESLLSAAQILVPGLQADNFAFIMSYLIGAGIIRQGDSDAAFAERGSP
jgi:radical SAM protein with 4Fe4S-binding SPASM domain